MKQIKEDRLLAEAYNEVHNKTEKDNLQSIIKSFVSKEGQKYKDYDCKTVTRAFVNWAQQNKIPVQVILLAPPSGEFLEKHPQYKGSTGEGNTHIMPVIDNNAIDFTARQFGINRPFDNPLVTPVNNLPQVYGKFGYFTDKPEWFKNKSYWQGPLSSVPNDIFDNNFKDEILKEVYNRIYLLEVALSNANIDKFNKKYQTNLTSDQLKDTFDRFNKQQPRLAIKDIYGYNSLQDLQNAIVVQSNKETIKSVKSNEVNVIINNDNLLVVEPLTENASVLYGANTKWCTAGKTNNLFKKYFLTDALVYFIDKLHNKKYAIICPYSRQYSYEPLQGYNQQDNEVPGETILHQFNLNWDKDIKPKLVSIEKKLSTLNGKYVQANVNSTVESWYVNGKLDRKDGPAQIYYFKNGAIKSQAWLRNGLRDREKAPAYTEYYENGNKKQEMWYKQGEATRHDGPAQIDYYDNGKVKKMVWIVHNIIEDTKYFDNNGNIMSGKLAEAYNNIIKFPGPAKTAKPNKPAPKSNKVAQFPAQSELSVPVYPRDDKYFAKHGAPEAINYVKQQLGSCCSVFGIWARESSDNTWKRVSRSEVTKAKAVPEKYNELRMYDDFWIWDNNKKFDINMRDVWEAMVDRESDNIFDQTGKDNIGTAKQRAYEQLKKLIFRFKASKEYKDCVSKLQK